MNSRMKEKEGKREGSGKENRKLASKREKWENDDEKQKNFTTNKALVGKFHFAFIFTYYFLSLSHFILSLLPVPFVIHFLNFFWSSISVRIIFSITLQKVDQTTTGRYGIVFKRQFHALCSAPCIICSLLFFTIEDYPFSITNKFHVSFNRSF